MTGGFSVLGQRVVRKDAIEKVKGEARFVADIQLPGMLHARFLRSPHAHARIKRIDTSRALAMPGVKCILTFGNVPRVHPVKKLEFLLDETVHHPGEEVAAVAALTTKIADEAVRLIEVEYEVLPAIADFEEALRPEAPLAHQDYGTNIFHGTDQVRIPRISDDGWLRLEVGDVDKGFAEADYILETTGITPVQYNCSPMPRAVVCQWTGDKLTCWADTQLPLWAWQDLYRSLGVPASKVRLISNQSVGGYGGKKPEKTALLVAIMAARTGRPVKAVFTRAEDFIGTHHRINYRNYNKIGVKKDGAITAMHSRILANWGSDTTEPYVCQSAAILNTCTMLYDLKNSRAETCGVMTNTLGYGAMNGFGDPEAIYAVEGLIDEAAERIGMDPVEFRRRNCTRYGGKALTGEQVITGPLEWGILGTDMDSLPELVQKCAQSAGWEEKWRGWKTPVAVNGCRRKGIGIAIGMHHTRFWPCSAVVKMNQDGTANVLSGAVEMGQGYATAIAQVVAETLGIRYEDVTPTLSDTGATPAARGNVASTGVSSAVNAARLAAEEVKRQFFQMAASRLRLPADNLEAREGVVRVKGTDKQVPIADLCSSGFQIIASASNPPQDSVRDKETGRVIYSFAAAVTIAEVDVDTETGNVEVTRITTGHDCGRAINPTIIENQIDLGLTMAQGWARSENLIVDRRSGVIVNPNLVDYKLLTFIDVPRSAQIQKIVLEKPCAWGPYGAKGFSETAFIALSPAIANAFYNATGVRMRNGQFDSKNVLRELRKDC